MLSKKVNTNLILAVTCLYHTIQELFCNDKQKREQALKEYQEYKMTFINFLDYISEQAEKFHAQHIRKGGVSDGNSGTAAVETKKELLNEEGKLINCPVCHAETRFGSTEEIMDGLFVYHCWKCDTHILHEQ